MDISVLKSKLVDLDAELRDEAVTPYKASKIVNEALNVKLPPQMFYNYIAKGYIVADENKKIAKGSLIEFIERYALRNIVSVR